MSLADADGVEGSAGDDRLDLSCIMKPGLVPLWAAGDSVDDVAEYGDTKRVPKMCLGSEVSTAVDAGL